MRKSVVFTVIAIAAVALFLSQRYSDSPQYTTTPEAYDSYLKGDQALNAFQFRRAEHLLQEALELDPGFAMAQAALTEVYGGMGSKETYKESHARADSLAKLLVNENERMLVQLRLCRFDKERTACRDSLLLILKERLPEDPIVMVTTALRAMDEGEPEAAESAWHALLEVDPNYSRAYNWLGYLKAGQGKYDEAISHLQKYAFLSPDIANPHDSLGEILSYIGRYEDAEREFRTALEIQPDFFHSLLHLARVYLEQGKIHKGVDILERTRDQIAGTKFEYQVDQLLVSTYFSNKLNEECGKACQRMFTAYPKSFDGAFFRTLYLAGAGEYDQSKAVFDSLMTEASEWPYFNATDRGKMHLARIQHTFTAIYSQLLGELDIAAVEWEKSLLNSVDMPPHELFTEETAFAEVLLELERYEEAYTRANQVLAINPRLIHPLLVHVASAASLGHFKEAHASMAKLDDILAQADPDLPAAAKADSLRAVLVRLPSS